MIGRILAGRPHIARSACLPGVDPNSAMLRLLAQLTTERVPVNLEPLYAAAPARQIEARAAMKAIRFTTGGAAFEPVVPKQEVVEPTPVVAVIATADAAPAQVPTTTTNPTQVTVKAAMPANTALSSQQAAGFGSDFEVSRVANPAPIMETRVPARGTPTYGGQCFCSGGCSDR